jgi:hypothetical protein
MLDEPSSSPSSPPLRYEHTARPAGTRETRPGTPDALDALDAELRALADPDEDPLVLRRRLEDAAQAAGALQAALLDLEHELLRLQQIVRRASPAMMQLMQAATEVRAAGISDR